MTDPRDLPGDRGLYPISVAAELTGVAPQMLRIYESRGLVTPSRTSGGTRRYSSSDIARIDEIALLLGAGLNFAGIGHVLQLRGELAGLRAELAALRDDASAER